MNLPAPNPSISRRNFVRTTTGAVAAACGFSQKSQSLLAQLPGERPARAPGITVLNPRGRVPVGLIIDDSTCLVNLNRFAMPQFDTAFAGANPSYDKRWRDWPTEIPDSFVRKFGEWAHAHGVKGKYSIVPFPGCVGRLDRIIPGWTQNELNESIELVRTLMSPNWDIHPEMVTHTRVIDTKTGHPYPDHSLKFMENWEWTTGRSADEIAGYLSYALRILKNIGLSCEGITTPGGFGNKALPELAMGTLQSVRAVFNAEIPHYFRHLYDKGEQSVAPRVEYAAGLSGSDPQCVVSIIACTGDWTGGWDCSTPGGTDKFITEDLKTGRMVEVIQRGEPAMMLAHWTGVYWNGQELGFGILQEVVRRLHARFDNLIWMKLAELARYWAAKELTRIERSAEGIAFNAPFACNDFTVRFDARAVTRVQFRTAAEAKPLEEVASVLALRTGTWCRETGGGVSACISIPRGASQLQM